MAAGPSLHPPPLAAPFSTHATKRSHNGELVQTYGLMEQDLMDKILGWLDGRKGKEQPFLMYYAPNAIHQ